MYFKALLGVTITCSVSLGLRPSVLSLFITQQSLAMRLIVDASPEDRKVEDLIDELSRTYLKIPRVRDGVHLAALLNGDRRTLGERRRRNASKWAYPFGSTSTRAGDERFACLVTLSMLNRCGISGPLTSTLA